MTIAAAATKYRYLGNGVTTTFSYLNRVYAETDLKVDLLVRSTSALVETLTLTTDYTVTIAANGQATVTITNATKIPSATQDILLRLDLPLTQATELPTGTPFPAKSVENMVDKVTSIVQALAEVDTRTLKFNAQSPVTNAVIANPVADATLAFDGTTGAIKAGASLGDIANASANATAAAASAASAAASAATIGGFDLSGTPAADDAILWDTGAAKFLRRTIAQLRSAVFSGISAPKINNFRLTLTTGVPVTTTDVTSASTVFLTPYNGNQIALFTAGQWVLLTSAQVSIALSGLTNNTLYDVFAWNNAGVVTLETLAWSNSGAGTSARATALAYQDGVLVRSGDATRRYLGTFRSTGTTTTEDSVARRFLYNYYNRVKRRLFGTETTSSWTYSTATWRQWNNATNAEYSLVQGVMEDALSHTVYGLVSNSTATARSALVGIGVNSSTSVAGSGGMIGRQAVTSALAVSPFSYATGTLFGFNTIKALEQGAGTDTQTWFGSSSWDVGIIGEGMF